MVLKMIKDKPKPSLTEDKLKEVILEAHDRHLKRVCGHELQAWDMTYHFLKHMGYNDAEWEIIEKIMMGMKGDIDVGLHKKP